MRVAVVGATGAIGARTVAALRAGGHETVPIARSLGIDVRDGRGLAAALDGVDVVVDVTSSNATDRAETTAFFEAVTSNLLASERDCGVRHHVALSIVGVDRVEGNAHYAGKRRQEALVSDGDVPWTIQRATQFFDFPAMVADWTTVDAVATLPPLLLQPVSSDDVAARLAEIASGQSALGLAPDFAGPDTHDLVDMARRTLLVRGDERTIRASWRNQPFSLEMAGEVLLPGPGAVIAPTTFDEWLAAGAPADATH
ncbi:MAG: SDR family oxidoreductase [Candidatus Sericytochromatia bacterium]